MNSFRKVCALGVILGAVVIVSTLGFSPLHPTADFLHFPQKLTPVTPYDVDTSLENTLQNQKKFAETQRIFEIQSWQMFISLNWPVDKNGKPLPKITDPGTRIWEKWKESYEIFKENGSSPTAWGSNPDVPEKYKNQVKSMSNANHEELLFRSSKFNSFHNKSLVGGDASNSIDTGFETDQAFTSAIYDQSGNVVYYEIRVNYPGFDYIVKNELYNIDGQIAFSKKKKTVSFPSSTREKASGVIELKFAWKIMVDGVDDKSRYYTQKALVTDQSTNTLKHVTIGLVGMHIGTKTVSSPQWIWATFEHLDNLETDALSNVKPSFYNPDCSICAVNLYPSDSNIYAGGKPIRNQIQRILPIPVATQHLNQEVQSILKKNNSYWQYYQLIGTQWPTQPSAPPYPNNAPYVLPNAVTNKSGGNPTPTYLTNMIMETYFQGATDISSTYGYNTLVANEPAYYQIEGNTSPSPSTVDTLQTRRIIFGTEGCITCHSSADIAIRDSISTTTKKRIAIYGPPRTADFEWLLSRKAQFKK